jgi:hypothetical protein
MRNIPVNPPEPPTLHYSATFVKDDYLLAIVFPDVTIDDLVLTAKGHLAALVVKPEEWKLVKLESIARQNVGNPLQDMLNRFFNQGGMDSD